MNRGVFVKAEELISFELWRAGLGEGALWTGMKTKTISTARQKIIMRLREETNLSWSEIATLVGLKGKGKAILTRRK